MESDFETPVVELVTVTTAFATAFPSPSVTVPRTFEVVSCATKLPSDKTAINAIKIFFITNNPQIIFENNNLIL